MKELLEFIFSSFWVWAGVTVHLALVCAICANFSALLCFRREAHRPDKTDKP